MSKCEILKEQNIPEIYVTQKALYKMRYYIDKTDKEIGWLGYVDKISDTCYLIEDVFLLKQKVHSTTTEIDPDALASLATDLIKQGEQGIALYNKIRLWGHSHVDMSTSASYQDDKQMDDFATSNFYIRLIGNKRGEWNVCLYDFTNNILWSDLEMKLYFDVAINDKDLEKEIKDNVSTITYTTYTKPSKIYNNYYNKYDDYDGYDEYGVYRGYSSSKKEKEEETQEEEEITTDGETGDVLIANELNTLIESLSEDENECMFGAVASLLELKKYIYDLYGYWLKDKDLRTVQKGLEKKWIEYNYGK